MYWQKRLDRDNPDQEIEEKIFLIREEHPNYGYRGITRELRDQGQLVNKKKVQRLVQKNGLQVIAFTRKSRKYNSYKGTVGKVAKNLIHRRFYTSIPHQKITTDTTEFKYYEQDQTGVIRQNKLYLDPFLDMYNSEIISYSISEKPSAEAVMTALKTALTQTDDCVYRRTFHSDQGWAYQMKAYRSELKDKKIFQSMSRKGNCLDNSLMENFFSILKQEIYHGNVFRSYNELKKTIEVYIHYYNHHRKKVKLDWMSPVQYRETHQMSA